MGLKFFMWVKTKAPLVGLLATAALGAPASAEASSRLQPVQAFCITYELEGLQGGEIRHCSRKYGAEQFERQRLVTVVGPTSEVLNQHVIYSGQTLYAIDLDRRLAVKTRNPRFDQFSGALSVNAGEAAAQAFARARGGRARGRSQTIAGLECEEYAARSGADFCMTPDGLVLEERTPVGLKRAIRVDRGVSGANHDYRLPANINLTEGPGLID